MTYTPRIEPCCTSKSKVSIGRVFGVVVSIAEERLTLYFKIISNQHTVTVVCRVRRLYCVLAENVDVISGNTGGCRRCG